jgi:3-deoxy-7-phosphoheptulonate synthase
MLIVMRADATETQIEKVVTYVTSRGLRVDILRSERHSMIGVLDDVTPLRSLPIDSLPGVERVTLITHPFKLASRTFKHMDSVIKANDLEIGGSKIVLIGATGYISDKNRLSQMARTFKNVGGAALKVGGTSDPSFNGFSKSEIQSFSEIAKETGLALIADVVSPKQVDLVEPHAGFLLVNIRNMDNPDLIQRVGQSKNPVVLERGLDAKIEEWLLMAHRIMAEGNPQVVLCECGIRTFDSHNALDVNSISMIKELSHLPVLVNSSLATEGRSAFLGAASKAALAAGADGLIIEIYEPRDANLSDSSGSGLSVGEFAELALTLNKVAVAIGRETTHGGITA